MTNPKHILATLLAVIITTPVLPALAEHRVGYNWLQDSLKNPRMREITLGTLAATGDKDLTEVFISLSKSSDKRKRMFATKALGNIGGKKVIDALILRVRTDPAMIIRAEAMALLLDMEAASTDLLAEAIKIDDEGIQSIAARMLAKRTGDAKAIEILKRLTKSREQLTSSMAMMSLLASGHTEYYDTLSKLMQAKTNDGTLRILLMHISEEKVTAAAPLAKRLINDTNQSLAIRILACRALGNSSPKASKVLFGAIRKALKKSKRDQIIFRVSVLKILAERKNARKYLKAIAKSKLTLPFVTLARFELARKSKELPNDKAEQAVDAAMKVDQPIVTNYVLLRAREDVKTLAKKADFYTPGMLGYINRIDPYSRTMGAEHRLATQVSNWLADLGTPRAMSGLKSILDGRYSSIKRCAAAGLVSTKNRNTRDMAAKLLESPYPEIASDGTLVLGRFGDTRARSNLQSLVKRSSGRNEIAALASWYLVKMNGQMPAALKMLKTSTN